ncbi:MAG: rhamnan synthesis F family protein, partial [Desulfuromusa sp.]|nr:rhamnan synthesis F family protein [Desulfuromusa sp.]
KQTQMVSEPLTNLESPPDQKIAIAVHVYYPELWPDIARRLQALSRVFEVFVTTTPEHAEAVTIAVRMDFPDARIDIQPNHGMDIVPFLRLIPTLVEEGYLAVCKLHTKKGINEQGELWRNVMLDTLIGDKATFDQITAAFTRGPSLQMAGPASIYLSAQKLMLDNTDTLEVLFQQLEGRRLPNIDWGFFSGTMFWARLTLLGKLARHVVQNIDQFETNFEKDGQFVHAIERIFGLLPALQKGQIGLLHPSRSCRPTHILQLTTD